MKVDLKKIDETLAGMTAAEKDAARDACLKYTKQGRKVFGIGQQLAEKFNWNLGKGVNVALAWNLYKL